jgi:hypothetical protein
MDKQELTNYRIIQKNGQTALTFERPITPADSVQILEVSSYCGDSNFAFSLLLLFSG